MFDPHDRPDRDPSYCPYMMHNRLKKGTLEECILLKDHQYEHEWKEIKEE